MADVTCRTSNRNPIQEDAIDRASSPASGSPPRWRLAALSGVPLFGLALIDPHPVWLVVLVIAARYGTRGLAIVILDRVGGAGRSPTAATDRARVLDTLSCRSSWGRSPRACWSAGSSPGTSAASRRWRARSPTSNGALPSTPDHRRAAPGGAGAARAQRSPRSFADVPAQRRAPAPRVRRGGRRPGGARADRRAPRRARGGGRDRSPVASWSRWP